MINTCTHNTKYQFVLFRRVYLVLIRIIFSNKYVPTSWKFQVPFFLLLFFMYNSNFDSQLLDSSQSLSHYTLDAKSHQLAVQMTRNVEYK